MTRDDAEQAIFGSFDGLSVGLGVIAGLLLTGKHGAVLVAAIALAAAEGVSMASGQFLSDPEKSLRRALVMGVATVTGGLLPVVPFAFLTTGPATVGFVVIVLVLATIIAELRPGSRVESHLVTLAVLCLACAAAVGASLATAGAS